MQEEDILFDINENSVMIRKREEPAPEIKKLNSSTLVPVDNQEIFSKQDQTLNKDPMKSEIVEFSPDLFGTPESDEELISDKNILVGEPEPSDEGF